MLTKLYDNIKKIIYENYKLILGFFVLLILFTIKLPFYINTPGGVIDISKKIKIDTPYEIKGSLISHMLRKLQLLYNFNCCLF